MRRQQSFRSSTTKRVSVESEKIMPWIHSNYKTIYEASYDGHP